MRVQSLLLGSLGLACSHVTACLQTATLQTKQADASTSRSASPQEEIYIGFTKDEGALARAGRKGRVIRDDPRKYPTRDAFGTGGWAGGEAGLWQLREEVLVSPHRVDVWGCGRAPGGCLGHYWDVMKLCCTQYHAVNVQPQHCALGARFYGPVFRLAVQRLFGAVQFCQHPVGLLTPPGTCLPSAEGEGEGQGHQAPASQVQPLDPQVRSPGQGGHLRRLQQGVSELSQSRLSLDGPQHLNVLVQSSI